MKPLLVALPLLLALAAAPAAAQSVSPINYTFMEAGFVVGQSGNSDKTGLLLKGSVETVEGLRVFGNYTLGTGDAAGSTYDFSDLEAGVGAFMPMSEGGDRTTVEWNLAYRYSSVSYDFYSASGDGYYLDAGVRSKVAPTLELNGGLRYRDIEGNNSRWLRLGMVVASGITANGFSFEYLTSDARSNPWILRIGYRIPF